jgi:hypothetical protein
MKLNQSVVIYRKNKLVDNFFLAFVLFLEKDCLINLINKMGLVTIKTLKKDQTRSTVLMHPSISGLFVTCAYLLQTTLPVCVTKPNSDTLTYRTVPKIS